ncbi:MAG TPA: hypothetical protein VGG33_26185 [Polyangia bacterium]
MPLHPAQWMVVVALALAAPDGGDVTVRTFRTDVQPRVDPVFGGVAELRRAIDEFLALEGEMKKTRDSLSDAVHQALQLLQKHEPPTATTPTREPDARRTSRVCPTGALPAQDRAREAGRRFLALGRRFEVRFREIRRGLSLGDTVGLTPDYRLKANRARTLYEELLRDYQEMRVAFHDQLGAELRYAGCKPDAPIEGPPALAGKSPPVMAEPRAIITPVPVADPPPPPDPENLADWSLAGPNDPLPAADPAPAESRGRAGNDASPAIWIEIDNTRCTQPSALTMDGKPVAPIPGGKKVQIRTRAGPHSLCVLPTNDKRPCGTTGTVRRAYLFEGWSMTVRCPKKAAAAPPVSEPRRGR